MAQPIDGIVDSGFKGDALPDNAGIVITGITSITTTGLMNSYRTYGSIQQLGTYLYQGYWQAQTPVQQTHYWAGHTVTANITGLTSAEQILAEIAMADWSRVANISFVLTNGPAQITYNHNGSGIAQTNDPYDASGHITSATIDISSDWAAMGNGVNNYMMQTYIHETGHAIGLGHLGPYDHTATYGVSNVFTDDTWQWSVMSYFSQNNFGGASYDYVLTPEMADIYAAQYLYGAPSSIGGLTYGTRGNAGAPFQFNAYTGAPAFTIYNTAYNNTLDGSGYGYSQVLDATPGHWSSIGGYTDNIGIYLTTNINNLVGGYGNDLIIPNPSLYGTLTGGGGFDIFQGTDSSACPTTRSRIWASAIS